MTAGPRLHAAQERQYTSWDRARLSVVVPIGVIVAVAIACIVVTALTSARNADTSAVNHEKQMFARAITAYGERVLREVESVGGSDAALRNMRIRFDDNWVNQHVGLWLTTFFNHDAVLVFDGNDRLVYSLIDRHAAAPAWLAAAKPVLLPLAEYMRGHDTGLSDVLRRDRIGPDDKEAQTQAAVIRNLAGRPAVIAGVAVGPVARLRASDEERAPIIVSVKFIDGDVLSGIAGQLRLKDLRRIGHGAVPTGDSVYALATPQGAPIAAFAWTPRRPGAEIVSSVVPFVAVALSGFALLAAFVLRYMRRTAAAIAAGETRLRHLAMHDPLCGLPNRIFFGERLEAVIREVRAGSRPAAVFYIDLDHFKDVNDTLGHPIGDELIRNVTLRLTHTLRGDDLVARLGGDEFAVISSIGDDPAKTMTIAQRIIATISAPYSINAQNIAIGASIGIAVIDKTAGAAADIMRYADMALYRAKNEGRNRACIYDAAMDADLSKRKRMEGDLREAIKNDGLEVHYQPIVNKNGESMVGVEALCRWTHPVRGEIGPNEFIATAEQSGLIVELGEWVLRRACLDGKAWPGLTMAVNVSPLQFRRSDFVDMVERTLKETGFDPARLEIEITESVLLGNVDTAEAAMLRLKALGVRLALDDFGTGYSSLLYLRRYPFDKLKIDRSFVLSIEKAPDAAAIVHAVVSLGRGLGMKVTAEGVETADQQLFLRAAGVHFMQGYRFGKAAPADEIAARLDAPGDFRPLDVPQALAS